MKKKTFLLTTMLLVTMLTFAGCGDDTDRDGRLIGNDENQSITQDTERIGDDIKDDVDDAAEDVKDAVTGEDRHEEDKEKDNSNSTDKSENKTENSAEDENRNMSGQ